MRRTLQDVTPELQRIAGVSGLKASDARLTTMVNLAIERLYPMVFDYPNTLHRLVFRQYDGIVALPTKYQSIVKVDIGGHHQQNHGHSPVVSQWYEFMGSGPGQQDNKPWAHAAIDRGTSPVFRQMIGNPMNMRLYSYADERVNGIVPTVTICGYDSNRAWVRSQVNGVWIDGVQLPLNGHLAQNWVDLSTAGPLGAPLLFSEITQVLLPVRNGIAELYWCDSLNNIYLTGRYDYFETSPAFRLYYFPRVQREPGMKIHALCRVAFRPVLNPTDPLLIGSLPALRLAIRALAKEDANDPQIAIGFWESARAVLKDETKQFYNGVTQPVVDPMGSPTQFGAVADVI